MSTIRVVNQIVQEDLEDKLLSSHELLSAASLGTRELADIRYNDTFEIHRRVPQSEAGTFSVVLGTEVNLVNNDIVVGYSISCQLTCDTPGQVQESCDFDCTWPGLTLTASQMQQVGRDLSGVFAGGAFTIDSLGVPVGRTALLDIVIFLDRQP